MPLITAFWDIPRPRTEAAAGASWQSWVRTWAWPGGKHRQEQQVQTRSGRRGCTASQRPGVPRACSRRGGRNPAGSTLTARRRLGAQRRRGRAVPRVPPAPPARRGRQGRGDGRGPRQRTRAPQARRSARARPSPGAEGREWRPAGGRSKERAVPCWVRESARRALRQRPGGAGRPGREGGPQYSRAAAPRRQARP